MARLREGDYRPLLRMDAKDVRFRFPGDSSWATALEGRGERVYENRYVIWGRIAWGLLREYEVFEDTQKAKALDEHLAQIGKL